jgi:hypothetical protein
LIGGGGGTGILASVVEGEGEAIEWSSTSEQEAVFAVSSEKGCVACLTKYGRCKGGGGGGGGGAGITCPVGESGRKRQLSFSLGGDGGVGGVTCCLGQDGRLGSRDGGDSTKHSLAGGEDGEGGFSECSLGEGGGKYEQDGGDGGGGGGADGGFIYSVDCGNSSGGGIIGRHPSSLLTVEAMTWLIISFCDISLHISKWMDNAVWSRGCS